MTLEQLVAMTPMDFTKWAIEEFHMEIPTSIHTIDDANMVGELLAMSSNKYFYLCELQGQLKILSREAGRQGNKVLKEDIIDKQNLVDEIGKATKQQYQTLSRMITVRYNNLEELKMTDGRSFPDDDMDNSFNYNKALNRKNQKEINTIIKKDTPTAIKTELPHTTPSILEIPKVEVKVEEQTNEIPQAFLDSIAIGSPVLTKDYSEEPKIVDIFDEEPKLAKDFSEIKEEAPEPEPSKAALDSIAIGKPVLKVDYRPEPVIEEIDPFSDTNSMEFADPFADKDKAPF